MQQGKNYPPPPVFSTPHFYDQLSDAIIVTDKRLTILMLNKQASGMFEKAGIHTGHSLAPVFQTTFNEIKIGWEKEIAIDFAGAGKHFYHVQATVIELEYCLFIIKPSAKQTAHSFGSSKKEPGEQQRWKLALQGSGDGMWEYNFQTGEVFYSSGYKEMLGYTNEEFLNTQEEWKNKIHPDDLPLVQQIDMQYEQGHIRHHSIEYRLRNKNGEYTWVLDRGRLTEKSADGKPVKITGTHTNITGTKQMLIELEKKEQQLRILSGNIPAVIHEYIFKKDGSAAFGFISNSCEKILGITSAELLSFNRMLHPDDLKVMEAFDNAATIAAKTFHFEGRLILPSGQLIWVAVQSSYSQTTIDGDIVFTGIILNITERKQQEEAIKENEIRFQNIAQSVPGVLYQWQVNFDGSFGFTYVSPKLKTYFDIDPADMDKLPSYIHPADKERWRQSLEEANKSEGEWNFQGRLLYPDGKIKWWKGSAMMSAKSDTGRIYNGIMIDMTAQLEAENKIRLHEQRFKAIFNSMYQFIGLANKEGILLEANDSVLQFSGLKKEEVVNRCFWDYPIWQKSSHTQEQIKSAFENAVAGEFIRFPIEFKMNGIPETIIDFSLKPVRNEDGEVAWIIPEGRNITRERITEMNIIKLQEQFISFMENTPALSWIIDDRNVIRYLNPPYLKAFNLTDDVFGKNMYEIFPKEICDAYLENNERVWQSGKALETIEGGIGPDGKPLIHQVFKFPLHTEGDTKLLGGTALDITELQRTQSDLQKSNERFEYAARATSDAIWDWDKENDIIYRGNGFEELSGYPLQADKMLFRLSNIHENDKSKVIASLAKAMNSTQDRWQQEYRFQCNDGSYKIIVDRAFILRNEKGEAIRMIGAMQDVTGQRMLEQKIADEEALKKRDILKAIIDAQERERSDISYELHENISQVLATSKLMLQMNAKGHHDAKYISIGLESLQNAINELRTISQQLNPGTVDIIGLQGAINDMIMQINLQGQVNVELIEADFDEQLLSKEIKISIFRILQEQLKNIQKHSRANRIQIKMLTKKGKVLLGIADNGQGFDPAITRMGLGLKNIMNRAAFHNGIAKVRSANGKGCFLQVEIPVA